MCLTQSFQSLRRKQGEYFSDFAEKENFLKGDQICYPKGKAKIDKFDKQLQSPPALPSKALHPHSIMLFNKVKVPCYQHTPLIKGIEVINNSRVQYNIYF